MKAQVVGLKRQRKSLRYFLRLRPATLMHRFVLTRMSCVYRMPQREAQALCCRTQMVSFRKFHAAQSGSQRMFGKPVPVHKFKARCLEPQATCPLQVCRTNGNLFDGMDILSCRQLSKFASTPSASPRPHAAR